MAGVYVFKRDTNAFTSNTTFTANFQTLQSGLSDATPQFPIHASRRSDDWVTFCQTTNTNTQARFPKIILQPKGGINQPGYLDGLAKTIRPGSAIARPVKYTEDSLFGTGFSCANFGSGNYDMKKMFEQVKKPTVACECYCAPSAAGESSLFALTITLDLVRGIRLTKCHC